MSEVEPFAPVIDLGDFDSLEDWRWLVGKKAYARLLTAMGDIFFIKKSFLGSEQVYLLDVTLGDSRKIAGSWDALKKRLASPDTEVLLWYKFGLLDEIHASIGQLSEGCCYSPKLLPILGGSFDVINYEQTPWHVHVSINGQIHEQIKDLPAGAKISGSDTNIEE